MLRFRTILPLLGLLLFACTDDQTPTPPPPTVPPTAVSLNTAIPPAPTQTAEPALPTAVPTLMPETEFEAPVTAGEPFWVGRGMIQEGVFTPDGTAVAVGWAYGVSLTEIESGLELWWMPFDDPVHAIAMHPDGTAAAAALGNGSITIISLASGEAQTFAVGYPFASHADVSWSPTGEQLAYQAISPNGGTPIYLLDPASGAVSEVPDSEINNGVRPYLVWSPDGRTLTLADLATCARSIDVLTGETRFPFELGNGCYDTWVATYAPDGRLALHNQNENRVDLVNPQSGELLDNLDVTPLSFTSISTGHPLQFSPDGRYLISRGGLGIYNEVGPFVVYDVLEKMPVVQLQSDVPADGPGEGSVRLAVTAIGDTFLSLLRDGRITTIQAGESAETILTQIPVLLPQFSFVWSTDGTKIGFANQFGGTVVMDVASNEVDLFVEAGRGLPALSPDGRLAAVYEIESGEVVLYDTGSGEVVRRFSDASGLPFGGAFSPDGTMLAYQEQNQLSLAAIPGGEILDTLIPLEGDAARVINVYWSPTDEALVTTSTIDLSGSDLPGPLVLWQLENGRFTEQFRTESVRAGYSCCLTLAAFNPSGSRVVLESMATFDAGALQLHVYDLNQKEVILDVNDYRLEGWQTDDLLLTSEAQFDTRQTLWDVATGATALGMAGHTGDHIVAPNGRFFVRQSGTGPDIGRSIDLFWWQSSQPQLRLTHGSDILQLQWRKDGRFLGSLANDGSIRIWPVSLPDIQN